jgi:hypothetical protein
VQLLTVSYLQGTTLLLDCMDNAGEFLVSDLNRRRIVVAKVQPGKEPATCILSVKNLELTFKVRAVATACRLHLSSVNHCVIPASGHGLHAHIW